MEVHIVPILSVQNVTYNVKSFRVAKPPGYQFVPGQATEVSINNNQWKDEKRPFTFTSLNDWPYLEFTTKIYHNHHGVTNELNELKPGDELIIRDVWGAIAYKGAGYFLAGGAGITPFIAILRQLNKDNKVNGNQLFFSNQTSSDIILHEELEAILGNNAHFLLTREDHAEYEKGRIDKSFLTKQITDFNKPFYICGPDAMVNALTHTLGEFGVTPESLVFEQ